MLLKNGGTFREMLPSQRRIAQRLGRESRYHAHQKVAVAKPLEVPLLSAGEPRSPLPGVPDREMQATAGARPDTSPWKLTHISES